MIEKKDHLRGGRNSLSRKCCSLSSVAPPSACFLFDPYEQLSTSPPKSLAEIIRAEIAGVSCLSRLYPDCDTSDLLASTASSVERTLISVFLVEIS